jgi:hypothetical protein
VCAVYYTHPNAVEKYSEDPNIESSKDLIMINSEDPVDETKDRKKVSKNASAQSFTSCLYKQGKLYFLIFFAENKFHGENGSCLPLHFKNRCYLYKCTYL